MIDEGEGIVDDLFPMVDLHAHILPGLDHGPRSWEEAESMARIAVADGITEVAATPHVNFEFKSTPDRIRAAVEEFRRRLIKAAVLLKVHVGGDYHLSPELLAGIDTIITLGDNGRYFLIELPSTVAPPNTVEIMKRFIDRGLVPIVTHPERNPYLMARFNMIEGMLKAGCVIQVTAGCLLGQFGEGPKKNASKIIKAGLCQVVASDAHWETERTPVLSPAIPLIAGLVGIEAARSMVYANPLKILHAEGV